MRFEKWHGLGNDFVVVVDASPPAAGWAGLAPAVCDRHLGVGADGILVVGSDPPTMTVFNADGSRPEMCGNGLRCAVAALAGATNARSGRTVVRTGAGELEARWEREGDRWSVSAEIGRASFDPRDAGAGSVGRTGPVAVAAAGVGEGHIASIGNPHWVFLDPPADASVAVHGQSLEHDSRFEARTNVEFVRRVDDRRYRVDVWERGCGVTRACGTGAAAVAATLVALEREPAGVPLTIELPGGALSVDVSVDGRVRITGPTRRVFVGEFEVPAS